MIKIPNPIKEPPASCKSPNGDLKDTYVLCPFKIKIEKTIHNMGVSKTSDPIIIQIMSNHSQKPLASSKLREIAKT